MKPYVPQIRIISVDHDKTVTAATRLRHALDKHKLSDCPVLSVFCHLEAGRCGIKAGVVALEIDGSILWGGKELTEEVAAAVSERLPAFIQRKREEYGML